MLVIAHRGLSAHYPENTLEAFKQAIEQGAKAIEFDVHQVHDEFIVFHDYDIKRLTGKEGKLAALSKASLKALRVANKHPIPTLQEVLALAAGKVLINIELKSIADPEAFSQRLCKSLQTLNPSEDMNIVLSSFNHPMLASVKHHFRNTRLESCLAFGALIAHLPIDNAQYAIDMQADVAAIDAHLVNIEFVTHAHQHNLKVWCYTVNDAQLLQKLHDLNVDGVFCDDALWAEARLGELTLTN
jgi:glycerophosphoryl diester phosphodiesterase